MDSLVPLWPAVADVWRGISQVIKELYYAVGLVAAAGTIVRWFRGMD